MTPGWASIGGVWTPFASPGGFYSVLQPANSMSTFLRGVQPAPPPGWLGDGVTLYSQFTGGTVRNFVRLEAPLGMNLDGKGNNFIQTATLQISGHMPASTTVPTALTVDRATCSYIGTTEYIDLFLTTQPGATISVTSADLGTASFAGGLVTDASGHFYASFPGNAKSINVTSTATGSSPKTVLKSVDDYVNITQAAYSLGTGILTIQATSSDFIKHPTNPPTLTATATGYPTFGAAGATLNLNSITGVYSLSVPATSGVLPPEVTVKSTVLGVDKATVAITP